METQQPAFSRQHWAGRLLRLYLGLPHLSTDPIRAWRLPTANKPAPVRNTCSRRILRCGLTICRSEEHTSELQSQSNLVCRLLLEKKKKKKQELQFVV